MTLRRLHTVRDGDRWFGPAQDDDSSVILTPLDFAKKARNGQPPASNIRWCTGYFKGAVCDRWLREHKATLGDRAVLLTGERHTESPGRSRLEQTVWRFGTKHWDVLCIARYSIRHGTRWCKYQSLRASHHIPPMKPKAKRWRQCSTQRVMSAGAHVCRAWPVSSAISLILRLRYAMRQPQSHQLCSWCSSTNEKLATSGSNVVVPTELNGRPMVHSIRHAANTLCIKTLSSCFQYDMQHPHCISSVRLCLFRMVWCPTNQAQMQLQ